MLDCERHSHAIVGYHLVVGSAPLSVACAWMAAIFWRANTLSSMSTARVVSAPFRAQAAFNEAVAALLPDEERGGQKLMTAETLLWLECLIFHI